MRVNPANADVPEDVGRGLLLSLIAFPIAIVISAVGSSFLTGLGFVTGFFVGVGVTILISLYRKEAGVAVVRRGTAPVALLGILLTLLAVLAGVLGRAYGLYHAVNLRSGLEALNSPASATVVVRPWWCGSSGTSTTSCRSSSASVSG
ncbi:hypothetical protein [Glaciihabitans sp. UYNi722]|uniref:hypothetical protein n=1 Tax=Glaciihabitans sp. UYNi722 TaxID=3156344 RepID=UPI003396BAED